MRPQSLVSEPEAPSNFQKIAHFFYAAIERDVLTHLHSINIKWHETEAKLFNACTKSMKAAGRSENTMA